MFYLNLHKQPNYTLTLAECTCPIGAQVLYVTTEPLFAKCWGSIWYVGPTSNRCLVIQYFTTNRSNHICQGFQNKIESLGEALVKRALSQSLSPITVTHSNPLFLLSGKLESENVSFGVDVSFSSNRLGQGLSSYRAGIDFRRQSNAGIDFRRHNLTWFWCLKSMNRTSVDVRFWRLKSIPVL